MYAHACTLVCSDRKQSQFSPCVIHTNLTGEFGTHLLPQLFIFHPASLHLLLLCTLSKQIHKALRCTQIKILLAFCLNTQLKLQLKSCLRIFSSLVCNILVYTNTKITVNMEKKNFNCRKTQYLEITVWSTPAISLSWLSFFNVNELNLKIQKFVNALMKSHVTLLLFAVTSNTYFRDEPRKH